MVNRDQLAASMLICSIRAWRGMIEHAVRRHASELIDPTTGKWSKPNQMWNRVRSRLNSPVIQAHLTASDRLMLGTKLGEWSDQNAERSQYNIETVEMLAWVGSLRKTIPPWGALTPAPMSQAAAIMQNPDMLWSRAIRVRPEKTLRDARRQAAAWRWRLTVEWRRRNMASLAQHMKSVARRETGQIPTAASIARGAKWFEPIQRDFPVGELILPWLSWQEVEKLNHSARVRNGAMQFACSPSGTWEHVLDEETETCWGVMTGQQTGADYTKERHRMLAGITLDQILTESRKIVARERAKSRQKSA
jgi:hypothetical protein